MKTCNICGHVAEKDIETIELSYVCTKCIEDLYTFHKEYQKEKKTIKKDAGYYAGQGLILVFLACLTILMVCGTAALLNNWF